MKLDFNKNVAICIGDVVTLGDGSTRMIIHSHKELVCLLDLEDGVVKSREYDSIQDLIEGLHFNITDIHRNSNLVLSKSV